MIKEKEHNNNSRKNLLDLFLSDKLSYEVPVKTSSEVHWDRLKKQIENRNVKEKRIILSFKYQLAAAASILILTGLFLFNQNRQITYVAKAGEITEYTLPDKSVIVLNADSRISFNKKNWNKSREVKLTGEAYFKVKKGSWFTVNTEVGSVKVLGTSFNVYNRDNDFRVACFTGKVHVKLNQSNQSVILTQGLSTESINRDKLGDPKRFNISQVGKWQKGEFYYSNEKLINVFKEIERQFNVKIEAKNIDYRYYSGFFTTENINDALQMVCLPMNLKYSFKDESTIIIKN